jgi:hypothetical protein
MPSVTYTGPISRGQIRPVDRLLRFERGVPVEVTADEAKALGDEWSTSKPVKAEKATKSTPAPAGTKAADPVDTKEP